MWGKRENNRKTRVVLREMQGRIILQTAVFPMASLVVMTIAVTVLCGKLIDDAAAIDTTLPNLERLFVAILLLTPAMAGAILFVAFRFSHRIAGPAYRIVQSLKKVQQGDLGFRVRLRRDDFLTEIADELNKTLDVLQDESRPEGSARQQTGEQAAPAAATSSPAESGDTH